MPSIMIQPINTSRELSRWTLSERIISKHLADDNYVAQLHERLTWATSDAEVLDSQTLTADAKCSPASRTAT